MANRLPPNAIILNMEPNTNDSDKDLNKSVKKQDTLFGPNIGIVTAGPDWTDLQQEKGAVDELTPDIVKNWVAKSKEASQPTTTLQALVNLKRPTLRLSPLAPPDETTPPIPDIHHEAHALEFEYDCDAPKCGIRVYVVLSPSHPLAKKSEENNSTRISVFETVVDGGFARVLKLEEGAVLELGQFVNNGERSGSHIGIVHEEGSTSNGEVASAEPLTPGIESPRHADRKKRFTTFNFRKHTARNHSVSGPALAVVDAEVGGATDDTKGESKHEADEGVKVVIKLLALDQDGHGLSSANEQVTYLHVIKLGNPPAEGEEDKRPWVVKVVKREATIGPHTFHLHEIYGLSSHSTQPTPAATVPSPTSTETHTYPPVTAATVADEEPSSECLLCLSSPREVVLLPCRHLVACRECAVNMVEYGAGGNIVHADEPTTGGEAPVDGVATGVEPGAATAAGPSQHRRKRRAKGWFCPVCRQPYTSLLRITTTMPTKDEKDSDGESGKEDTAANELPIDDMPSPPPAAASRLAGITRPRFLRGFSRTREEQDLERGLRVPAASA